MRNFAGHQTFVFDGVGKRCKNSIVLAPLTHNMSAANGDMSLAEVNWLSRCAAGGFGMIITAATLVNKLGQCWAGQPSLLEHNDLAPYKHLAQVCKQNDVLCIVQLHHGGLKADSQLMGSAPLGPNDFSHQAIYQLIDDFVSAAYRAYQAGFDGVELHGAHDYALCNFLNAVQNTRTDEFGGDILSRAKILFAIIDKIRALVGREFIIGVRLSPENYASVEGIDVNEQIQLAKALSNATADYVHMSMHNVFKQARDSANIKGRLLQHLRNGVGQRVNLMVAGQVREIDDADKALELGADLVAIGKMAIGNPDWVNRALSHRPLFKPPFTPKKLYDNGFSQAGVDYMAQFNGLVRA